MDYEQKYKEALSWAHSAIKAGADGMLKEDLERVFPELRESEDERIKKDIITFIKENYSSAKSWIAWLEKQGEQKPEWIQWTGKNLKEVIDFTGKSVRFNEWFKSWDEYETYVHSHGDIFKLFCIDGSHYEVPVGAWIIKTPEGYNIHSVFRFIQKPIDKIEPKFKVGDWITTVNDEGGIAIEKVVEFLGNKVRLIDIDGVYTLCPQSWLNQYHLWTIKDAKDGDVLVVGREDGDGIAICGKDDTIGNKNLHCVYDDENGFIVNVKIAKECLLHPATKEQRDLLFQKMKEAGYEWDAEKN